MTCEEAAAVPQGGILALQGLGYKGHIQPGQKVLINGAGGGAGTFAIQIAKSLGAEVTGVDNTIKQDIMRSTGADHVIDYTREDFTKNGRSYDRILDFAAYHTLFDYRRSLSPGGIYALVGGTTSRILQIASMGPLFSMTTSRKMGVLMQKQNRGIDLLIELMEEGKIKSVIDKVYPLREVPDALRYFGEGYARGKVVITLDDKEEVGNRQG